MRSMRKFTRGKIEGFLRRWATDEEVLDVGAGSTHYADVFPRRVTFDIDPERKPDVVGDIARMPFENNSYGTIVCSEVFEHLQDPKAAVSEIHRVLKPGGLLLLTTRFLFPIHDAPSDFWRYTPFSLRLLFKEWEILEIIPESDTFSTLAVLIQRIIFQTDVRGGTLTKGLLYMLAILFSKMDILIKKRWGDIRRTTSPEIVFSSGLYVVCRKKA